MHSNFYEVRISKIDPVATRAPPGMQNMRSQQQPISCAAKKDILMWVRMGSECLWKGLFPVRFTATIAIKMFLQKVHVESVFQNNRQKFRCQFFLGFVCLSRFRVFLSDENVFTKKIDQKSKKYRFSIFYHVFGRFSARGVQKHDKKYQKTKLTLVLFWLLTHLPTTGVTDVWFWRPLVLGPWILSTKHPQLAKAKESAPAPVASRAQGSGRCGLQKRNETKKRGETEENKNKTEAERILATA
jgi:hypothetical protein